CFH
ncbi:hypothetical protein D018_3162B, partial [Vibrio parahaemolyticus VP2007-007]